MTLVPEPPCSPTPEATVALTLPDAWWDRLRRSLETLAAVPTGRVAVDRAQLDRRLRAAYGPAAPKPSVTRWSTAHGDLHWANLTAPGCWLLDWEGWGRAPAGLDAASLYCYSLAAPELAARVSDELGDLLDTPDGVVAQLYAAARLLDRLDDPGIAVAAAVRAHATALLDRSSPATHRRARRR